MNIPACLAKFESHLLIFAQFPVCVGVPRLGRMQGQHLVAEWVVARFPTHVHVLSNDTQGITIRFSVLQFLTLFLGTYNYFKKIETSCSCK